MYLDIIKTKTKTKQKTNNKTKQKNKKYKNETLSEHFQILVDKM
jgi:hypothetical protein